MYTMTFYRFMLKKVGVLIKRILSSSKLDWPSLIQIKSCPEFPWSLWIWTSDVKGAGTDAQVFLQIYGEKGKSDEIKLENNSDSFEQGQLDTFMVSPCSSTKHTRVFPTVNFISRFLCYYTFRSKCQT